MRWLEGIADSMDMNLSRLQEMEKDRGASGAVVHGVAKSQKDSVTAQQPMTQGPRTHSAERTWISGARIHLTG